jgi:hypothetical protein
VYWWNGVTWQAARVESFVCRNYNEEGRRVFKRSRTTGSEHLPRCRRFLVADKQAMLQALADQAKAAKAEHGATTRAFKEADGARKAKAAAEKAARAKLPALQKRVAASRDEADQCVLHTPWDPTLYTPHWDHTHTPHGADQCVLHTQPQPAARTATRHGRGAHAGETHSCVIVVHTPPA